MNLTCNNKGCFQSSEALLDTKTNEVICQACGRAITNISEAMKRTLKGAGQVVRAAAKKAFMVHCHACHANREVVLNAANETICKDCKKPVIIQAAFKLAMQEAGFKMEKDASAPAQSETKPAAKKGAFKRSKDAQAEPRVIDAGSVTIETIEEIEKKDK